MIYLGTIVITYDGGCFWVSLNGRPDVVGLLRTDRFRLSALNDDGSLFIGNRTPDAIGEGGYFHPIKLAEFILERIALPGPDGALTVAVAARDFDALIGEFYDREL